MIHIAYLTSEYPHEKLQPAGGIGTFIKYMSHSLVNSGHLVTVFICNTKKDDEWFDDGVKIVELKNDYNGLMGVLQYRHKISKIIRKHIELNGVNIVESPDWEGLHAFCRLRVPLITRTHGSVTYFNFLAGKKRSKAMWVLEKLGYLNSNRIVAVSAYAGKMAQQLFHLKEQKIQLIHYGTDLEKFRVLPSVKENKNPLILHFGTLVRKKGVLDLPHIFNELHRLDPGYRLLILGKDTLDSKENKSTWELMKIDLDKETISSVEYLGPVPFDTVKDYIGKATACLFTSYAETFGLVTTESMAMGKPVIIYNFPWVREIIDHKKDGILIEPGQFKKAASTIDAILKDSDQVSQIEKMARLKVEEKFDLKKKVVENIQFYKNCLSNE